jgi:orotate phosphoribosyltransferase
MNLFQLGNFTLRSGQKSAWKIECDALTEDDWKAIAKMAVEILPTFGGVSGVPRGGLPFQYYLGEYCKPQESNLLVICEDVVTTGGSMERWREERCRNHPSVIGVCVFARGPVPSWVTPLFQMPVRK